MKEKYIDSSSRRDRLHLYIWMPKDQPKPGLIVQMTHGMVEHMGRYEELAQYLNAQLAMIRLVMEKVRRLVHSLAFLPRKMEIAVLLQMLHV